jgi:hypothetical protein
MITKRAKDRRAFYKAEKLRKKKEEELRLLKEAVSNSIISKVEFIDDMLGIPILDTEGYNQKDIKHSRCINKLDLLEDI